MNVVTRDTELSPSICHHNFTQSGAHLSSTAPMAVSVWSGSQQCALAGGPWCRPSGGHSLCCCTVLTVQLIVLQCQLCRSVQHSHVVEVYNIHMCTSNVHFHCTALFSIAACVLQFVHSTVQHCSAFQSVCCVEQLLPCSAAVKRNTQIT